MRTLLLVSSPTSIRSVAAARTKAAVARSISIRSLSACLNVRASSSDSGSNSGDGSGGGEGGGGEGDFKVVQTSLTPSRGGWTDESPSGGATELWVYRPERRDTAWPDPALGIFAASDPRFGLPGYVGVSNEDSAVSFSEEQSPQQHQAEQQKSAAVSPDVLSRPTNAENQAQVLYTAGDYLKHGFSSSGALSGSPHLVEPPQSYACAGMLENLPPMRLAGDLTAPQLLRREARDLFPERRDALGAPGTVSASSPNHEVSSAASSAANSSPLTVVTLAQRTEQDMSAWSEEMEEERDRRTAAFVGAAKEICARLASEGLWADFIDPSSGAPYYGRSSTSMFETDEKYRLLGYRIEDLGCCKVITDRDFGRNVLVGSIFTSAHESNPIIEEILADLGLMVTGSDNNGASAAK